MEQITLYIKNNPRPPLKSAAKNYALNAIIVGVIKMENKQKIEVSDIEDLLPSQLQILHILLDAPTTGVSSGKLYGLFNRDLKRYPLLKDIVMAYYKKLSPDLFYEDLVKLAFKDLIKMVHNRDVLIIQLNPDYRGVIEKAFEELEALGKVSELLRELFNTPDIDNIQDIDKIFEKFHNKNKPFL